uniref:Uncharacterized protein n=1 Tax=Ananas comosus var. bracteatus TaxID=296719 RepID=A0A6V7PE82_ANACO|nr:unnamed protein product [Ananas comosus var. bracteatus]
MEGVVVFLVPSRCAAAATHLFRSVCRGGVFVFLVPIVVAAPSAAYASPQPGAGATTATGNEEYEDPPPTPLRSRLRGTPSVAFAYLTKGRKPPSQPVTSGPGDKFIVNSRCFIGAYRKTYASVVKPHQLPAIHSTIFGALVEKKVKLGVELAIAQSLEGKLKPTVEDGVDSIGDGVSHCNWLEESSKWMMSKIYLR